MSSREGGQSPPPERSSGAQVNDTPADGQGVNTESKNKDDSKSQLEVTSFPTLGHISISNAIKQGLSSNPKGPLDEHLKDTVSKTMEPHKKL